MQPEICIIMRFIIPGYNKFQFTSHELQYIEMAKVQYTFY